MGRLQVNIMGLWGKVIASYRSTDSLIDREKWTKDIIRYLMIIQIIALIIIGLSTLANLLAAFWAYSILSVFLVSLPFWWGSTKGGWAWARFYPILLIFGIGIYTATGYLSNVSGLFFALSTMIAGMIVSIRFQRVVAFCSIITFTFIVYINHSQNIQDHLDAILTTVFVFIAIALLQWYYDKNLHLVLLSQAEANETLYAEMEHSKEMDASLVEKEKQLRRLTDNTRDLIGEIDTQGTFLYTSPSYYSSLGYPVNSLIGKNAFSLIHPEDLQNTLEAVQRSITTGIGESIRLRFQQADGKYKWFESLGSPLFTSDHQVGSFVISNRDITQQMIVEELRDKSEEREKNIINSLPLGIHMYECMADGSLVFSGFNPAANRILNFDHSTIIGKTIEEAFPNLADTEIPNRYREAALNGTPWDYDPVAYHDQNVEGSFEVHAFRTSPMHMVTVFMDVHRKKSDDQGIACFRREIFESIPYIT